VGLISSGIDKVTAFALPVGIAADGSFITEPLAVLVRWHSTNSDKFHQIYVNGEYAGSTIDTQQREMIVHFRSCFKRAGRIEVYAVEPEYAQRDFSDEAGMIKQMGRVRLCWPRSQNLPVGATGKIYSNNGAGDIDIDEPLTETAIRLWPCWQDKGGFGMSRFGRSDLGYDGSAATGFGRGSFGNGEFGFDADMVCWTSGALEKGRYKFAVKVTDAYGNKDEGENETEFVTVVPEPVPCEQVDVASFDKETNELILSIK